MTAKLTFNPAAIDALAVDVEGGMRRLMSDMRASAQQRAPVRKSAKGGKRRGRHAVDVEVETKTHTFVAAAKYPVQRGGKSVQMSGESLAFETLDKYRSRTGGNRILSPKLTSKLDRGNLVYTIEGKIAKPKGDQAQFSRATRKAIAKFEGVENIGSQESPKFVFGGFLRRNIVSNVERAGWKIQGSVTSEAPYSEAVEYGYHPGGGMKKQPFMRPAFEGYVPDGQTGANNLAARIKTRG